MLFVVGLVVGGLGRLFVPGRPPIPRALTMIVGVAAAFGGFIAAGALGVNPSSLGGIGIELGIIIAAVVIAANLCARSAIRGERSTRRVATPSMQRPPPDPDRVVPAPDPVRTPADPPRARQTSPPSAIEVSRPPDPPRSQVFVSYRRTDGGGHAAGRIVDHLRARLGRDEVFIDLDSLPAGADFIDGVIHAIERSAVVLVVVGDQWLMALDSRGRRRLDDPNDTVRLEIEYALRLRKLVLPVLLNTTPMPRADQLPRSLAALPRLQGIRLDHESWSTDMAQLTREVTRLRR